MIGRYVRRPALALLALFPAALAACGSDDLLPGPGSTGKRVEVIVNSQSKTLSVVSADSVSPTARTIELGAQGSPVSAAARGAYAVVPMGNYPNAVVVDLRTNTTRLVALPANSGATGAAFLNDSIAFVGNPNRNTVTPINVRTGTAGAEIAVGVFPQALVSGNGNVYVLNANLVNFSPAGPGSVSVIGAGQTVTKTIPLKGQNPNGGVVVGNTLVVINAGSYGGNNGSLSLVDVTSGTEAGYFTGFGDFPGAVDVGPDGLVYVGIYGAGIVTFNVGSGQFVRGLNNPIKPGNQVPVSALAFDYAGRLHTLAPGDCTAPGKEYGLESPFTTATRTVTTGICPFSITFATVPAN